MSLERVDGLTAMPSFSPDPETVWQSAEWMEDVMQPANRNYPKTINEFWEKHGEMYIFTKGMSEFRRYSENLGIKHTRSYERGVIFVTSAIEKKYENEGDILPQINQDQLRSFFESLLIFEDDRSILSETKGKLGLRESQLLSPQKFIEGINQGRVERKLIEKLEEVINTNKINQIHRMNHNAFSFDYHIRRRAFITMFGPNPGLSLGILDAYTAFSQQYEKNQVLKKLNNMWDKEVK